MDVPGLSLFQGAESIKLNTSTQQRIEEEDALEDQKRRNEELKNELQNAFDDLDDEYDDEEDISVLHNSTNQHSPAFHANKRPIRNGFDQARDEHTNNDLANELQRVKNALASKSEEVKNISAHNASEQVRYKSQIDELKKRLAIAEAEKERAHMTRKQTHELVVESKQKLAEQEVHIVELNARIKLLDARNLELVTELEHNKSMLSDVQHKYHMVERNANLTSDKHNDGIVKQINERHVAQVDMMQQQINMMRNKLEERDNQLKRLMIQNAELHRSREGMLIDKADTINLLTQKMEVSQRQCQNLLMKNSSDSDLIQENIKLMRSVSALEQQTEDMQKTINSLTSRLELTTAELEQMTDSAIHEETSELATNMNRYNLNGIQHSPLSHKPSSNLLHKRLALGISSSTPIIVEDQLIRLKQEFNRCLTDQKSKRQEILALKTQLSSQTKEVDRLKADENQALIDLNINKEKTERLENKLKMAERQLFELKKLNSSNGGQSQFTTTQAEHIEEQVIELQKENEMFRQNCDHLHKTVKELEDERDKIDEKYRNACKENTELQTKLDLIMSKTNIHCLKCEKEKFLLKDSQQECTRLKELYIQLTGEKDDVTRQLAHLQSTDVNIELVEQKEGLYDLERALQLAELKCTVLMKILDREKIDYEKQIDMRTNYEKDKIGADIKERKNTANSCTKCIDLTTKIAQFDIKNLQLQTSCSNYLKEIHDLKKSLKQTHHTIGELEKQMTIKEEHDKLITDLKQKAEQFEEFMRNQSPTKHHTLDSGRNCNRMQDQCVSTDDLLSVDTPSRSISSSSPGSRDRSTERKIREEMARAMALKVKAAENYFKDQSRELEDHIQKLTIKLNEMQQALSARENDVSTLKQCILSERAAIKTILEKKDMEAQDEHRKQYELLRHTRSELDTAYKRIDFLTKELQECGQQFYAKRHSMDKLMNEWKIELASYAEREGVFTQQIRQMENDHEKFIQNLNDKYIAAKKTAANYKKYSDDKERHIERESERIKKAYETAVKKVKENMETVIKEHEKQANKRIAEIQAKYDNEQREEVKTKQSHQ